MPTRLSNGVLDEMPGLEHNMVINEVENRCGT
jgi:hypothetical protein